MPRTSPALPPNAGADRLIADLFGTAATTDPLAGEIVCWLDESGRFRAFVVEYRDKIRRKLRGALDADASRDVRAELQAAHRLLDDRRIEIAFEAYGSGRRGPDFTITLRGERSFNLEVTRLHGSARAAEHGGPLLPKLRQLPPSVPNALLIAIDAESAESFDVVAASRALRARADRKDEAFFVDRGFTGTRDFYDRYLRLGAVFVWSEQVVGGARATVWTNTSARIAVPDRAARACLACLRAG